MCVFYLTRARAPVLSESLVKIIIWIFKTQAAIQKTIHWLWMGLFMFYIFFVSYIVCCCYYFSKKKNKIYKCLKNNNLEMNIRKLVGQLIQQRLAMAGVVKLLIILVNWKFLFLFFVVLVFWKVLKINSNICVFFISKAIALYGSVDVAGFNKLESSFVVSIKLNFYIFKK